MWRLPSLPFIECCCCLQWGGSEVQREGHPMLDSSRNVSRHSHSCFLAKQVQHDFCFLSQSFELFYVCIQQFSRVYQIIITVMLLVKFRSIWKVIFFLQIDILSHIIWPCCLHRHSIVFTSPCKHWLASLLTFLCTESHNLVVKVYRIRINNRWTISWVDALDGSDMDVEEESEESGRSLHSSLTRLLYSCSTSNPFINWIF